MLFSNKYAFAQEHINIHEHNDFDLVKAKVVPVIEEGSTYKKIKVIELSTGEELEVTHYVSDHPAEVRPDKGDYLLIYKQKNDDGSFTYYVTSYLKERAIIFLGLMFVFMVILVGGIHGVKALISLGFVGIIIWRVMIPLIINGFNPILVAIIVSCIATAFTMFAVGGFGSKSISAIIGTSGGLVCAGIIAIWAGKLAHLSGFSNDYVSIINFSGDFRIDPKGLLFSAIIIGALGAIMDVGMAISSAVFEIKRNNSELNFKQLSMSGLNVGRDIIGTMTNTLILAYLGTSLALVLLFYSYNINITRILNLDMIATEIVRMMAGSIGLVLTVPITAIASGYLLTRGK